MSAKSPLQGMRVGYVPYAASLKPPGDRRRFGRYAQARGITFEIADPSESYDVVVLSERADISVWCDYAEGKIVYDLIDSYLAIPRTSWKGRLRGVAKYVSGQYRHLRLNHWRAIEIMCGRADAVICTTAEQRSAIAPHCPNVHMILDVHSMVATISKQNYAAQTPFRIVWEGLPQTLSFLAQIVPALERVRFRHPIEVTLVTDAEYFQYLGKLGRSRTADLAKKIIPFANLCPWQEDTIGEIICGHDLAIIPLALDDPFVSGKPENKMLLFWRMGLPVLASATPAYVRAMNAAGQNWHCRSVDEWEEKLMALVEDEAIRQSAGQQGRRYADEGFSEELLLNKWDAMFASLWP